MHPEDLPGLLARYQVVLEPDENVPEWWAGAPSVAVAPDGTFYLAARMREGRSPRGRRGYEIRLLKSRDGVHFAPVGNLRREDMGVPGLERPSLRWDPRSGRFRLFACAGLERGWAVFRFQDAADPADFDPRTVRLVLAAQYPDDGFVYVTGYKDPVLHWDGRRWHLFVTAADRVERIRHFVSPDGDVWERSGPVLENAGWHHFFTRPASVLPLSVGYLFVYEGSSLDWHDPVYNIATGLAYSPDLETFVDLTPREPLLRSTTPGDYHTWRYSDWILHEGRLYVYFEAARPNNTSELRVAVLDAARVGTHSRSTAARPAGPAGAG